MSRSTVVLAMRDTHAEKYADRPGPVSIGTLPVWDLLEEAVEAAGHRFMRLEQFRPPDADGPVVLLWDFGSFARLPRRLRGQDLERVVAWSLESPLVAHRAYHRLDDIACEADAVLAFSGARELIAPARRHKFTPIYWPRIEEGVVEGPPFEERELLVMVNSRKRANAWWDGLEIRDPYSSARRLAASALAATYPIRGRWRAADLYEERLHAIEELADHPGFHLYGPGWDEPMPGRSEAFRAKLNSCYRGPTANKLATMSRYRFALVIENTIFPGYITEKVFDAAAAGAVPIYLGAPDSKYFLSSAITRISRGGYGELIEELAEVDEATWQRRRLAGTRLLESASTSVFDGRNFVARFMEAIEKSPAADDRSG